MTTFTIVCLCLAVCVLAWLLHAGDSDLDALVKRLESENWQLRNKVDVREDLIRELSAQVTTLERDNGDLRTAYNMALRAEPVRPVWPAGVSGWVTGQDYRSN